MKALVLAAGTGTEMMPLSKYCPKTMLKVHGKFVIEYVIDGLLETGIEEFVIVVGHQREKLERVLEEYRAKSIND